MRTDTLIYHSESPDFRSHSNNNLLLVTVNRISFQLHNSSLYEAPHIPYAIAVGNRPIRSQLHHRGDDCNGPVRVTRQFQTYF